jgi:hydrogenase nickel incorporation protein HypB
MSSDGEGKRYSIVTRITAANDRVAEENRRHFTEMGIKVVDVMGSPGAGKTALIEATIEALGKSTSVGVVTADIATTRDAERVAMHGVPVAQITTESFGGACHIEASALREAVQEFDLRDLDLLLVENVGNLVCPAEFDIGQHARAVVLSVTEGEDKPLKYPLAFRVAQFVAINKTDLLPHLRFDTAALRKNIGSVNPSIKVTELSAERRAGLAPWLAWLGALARHS